MSQRQIRMAEPASAALDYVRELVYSAGDESCANKTPFIVGRRPQQATATPHGEDNPLCVWRGGLMEWMQIYDPLGHWWLSTLLAALPIVVLFGLLAGLKLKPHWCAIAGAATADWVS